MLCTIPQSPPLSCPPLTASQSAMFQVLSALAHAHTRNTMHRDLKPHNILVDRRTGWAGIGRHVIGC